MARTPSTMMMPLGARAPSFDLRDPEGRACSLAGFDGAPALLVAFICNHCPFVKHVRTGFAALCAEYQKRGVAVVAITSNDAQAYPEDGPSGMAEEAKAAGYTFPYLFDETQEVAKAYGAACTPDFFLFDGERRLRLPGPDGRQPARQRCPGDGGRPASGPRRPPRGAARAGGPEAEPGLQHQVEARERASLLRGLIPPLHVGPDPRAARVHDRLDLLRPAGEATREALEAGRTHPVVM